MTCRSRSYRLLSALAALWLVFATGGQAALHQCPVHDGPVPASTAAAEHAGHHATPADQESGDHDCACLGQCCPAAALAAPVSAARAYDIAPPPFTFTARPAVTTAPGFLAFLVLSRTGPPALSA